MEARGIIKAIMDTEVVSGRFKKREVVITTEANTPYPQHVSFQVTQDKCDILDSYNEGDDVRVQFNLRGREWNGPQGVKYFNTLEIWRIEKVEDRASGPATPSFTSSSDNDDLPF